MTADLQAVIERAWDERDGIGASTRGEVRQAVDAALAALDSGEARIAEKQGDAWTVHQWLKKAVLLSFRLNPMEAISGAPGGAHWWDKVPSKFAGWGEKQFAEAAFRAVPGAIVRRGAYIAPGAVLMPSFVNIGAYVGEGDDGRHLGHRRQLRPDRQQRPYFRRRRHWRRARAAPGRPGDHRGRLLHRCPLGSRRGRRRRARLGPVDGRVPRRLDQDRRPLERRGALRPGAPLIRWSSPARFLARAMARPSPAQ